MSEKVLLNEIPVEVFNKRLSSLETVVKYLKENLKYRIADISRLTNRKYSTISTTYKKSKKKFPKRFDIKDMEYSIPILVFKKKKYSPLELVVSYLKNNYKLKFKEISKFLHRDPKTIYTVYSRYNKKNE